MPVKIREEVPADDLAIDAVTVAAFLRAEHTRHTEQHIVNALRCHKDKLSNLALQGKYWTSSENKQA